MTALKATEQASLLGTFIPPGVIMPFGGATAPTGWLACNTATGISTTTYAALFAAIGYAWGNPGGGLFNIPDFRGRFPRGVDGAIGRDPDRTRRIACNAGGNAQDNVGSVQGGASAHIPGNEGNTKLTTGLTNGNQSADHAHTLSDANVKFGGNNNNCGSVFGALGDGQTYRLVDVAPSPNLYSSQTLYVSGGTGGVNANHNHAISGDLETRPVNANVNYIIKI
jgi:microcystin-dependent protein